MVTVVLTSVPVVLLPFVFMHFPRAAQWRFFNTCLARLRFQRGGAVACLSNLAVLPTNHAPNLCRLCSSLFFGNGCLCWWRINGLYRRLLGAQRRAALFHHLLSCLLLRLLPCFFVRRLDFLPGSIWQVGQAPLLTSAAAPWCACN